MENARHTPGTWHHDPDDAVPYLGRITCEAADGETIEVATVSKLPNAEERLANGHLVAAAPDLAEASWAILDAMLNQGNNSVMLLKATAKLYRALSKAGIPFPQCHG